MDFPSVLTDLDALLAAAVSTVLLSLASMTAATLIGVVCSSLSLYAARPLRAIVRVYVELFRGTPLLVQILLFYYLPAGLGLRLSPVQVGITALALYFGAYVTEIFRGGFAAVPHGHTQAGRALGMSTPRVLARIVFPQVLAAVVPPLSGQLQNIVKATSLLAVISVSELTLRGRFTMTRTLAPIETWIVIALIYLAINAAIAGGSVVVERRLTRHLG